MAARNLDLIILAACVMAASVIAPPCGLAQSVDDLLVLHRRVGQLYRAGQYAEATNVAEDLLARLEHRLGPEHRHVGTSLNDLAELYGAQGRYADAEPLHMRALAIREKTLGPDHPDVATSRSNLAGIYFAQGRYMEAKPLFERALAIREKALGPEHPHVGQSLNNLAELYQAQGRYGEAEPLYERTVTVLEKALGPEHRHVGTSLNNLAALYKAQGRYGEAAPLLKRALAIREKTLGPEHPHLGTSLNNLALIYRAQGRYGEAEPLLKRALAMRESALGPGHAHVGTSLHNLAALYKAQGRYGEAEPLYKRALGIRENALGPDHPDVAQTINNLAGLYWAQGRYAEAEPLYQRTVTIFEKALGPDHPDVGTSLNNLSSLYEDQGRYGEAEPLLKRALAMREKALGAEHPDVATSLNNLAELYKSQGRHGEAESLFVRALAITRRTLGPAHASLGRTLNNLAELYAHQGRYGEAESLHKRALGIREKALGPDHPEVGQSLNNLAGLYFARKDWKQAADYCRRSTDIVVRRARRGTLGLGKALTGRRESEASRQSFQFRGLVTVAYRLSSNARGGNAELDREMFLAAQWAQGSEAAASLAQMAVRGAKGEARVSALVRERQDLIEEWQLRDETRSLHVSQAPDMRDTSIVAANLARLTAIDQRIAGIDKVLAVEFPDYAAFANPAPLSVDDVQDQLREGEALVLFMDTPGTRLTPEETFVWVLTKTKMRWIRSGLGTTALREKIARLRHALDPTAGGTRAAVALVDAAAESEFDLISAHELYAALLAPAEDLLRDKPHLIFVPSGPLTALPLHVLVTERPGISGTDRFATAQWLVRRHAITTLPSVASLASLRRSASRKPAPKPFVAFADPEFRKPATTTTAVADVKQREPNRVRGLSAYFRGASADAGALASLAPLPDSADEVRAIAATFGQGAVLRIGQAATEAEVKRLALDRYRVVHFATHGLVAGEVEGLAEPALALTVPEGPDTEDDGLLTASEVAGLKLNADWVLLSACNTAAGDRPGAEALSGLARAFFYAGTRALLVSHWPVQSRAAVDLTTRAFAELGRAPEIGRSEALRRAMLALIDKGVSHEANPAYWAPFVVVGEGGANR